MYVTHLGEIPKWINGTLYRNGPGKFNIGDKEYKFEFAILYT